MFATIPINEPPTPRAAKTENATRRQQRDDDKYKCNKGIKQG
jgi:hypothetical protein